jgi:ferredoxin
MKLYKIKQQEWSKGLDTSRQAYRLIGPYRQKDQDLAEFVALQDGQQPDLTATNTVLSPKAILFPYSETLFTYTTDPTREDCNLLKRPAKEYSPCAVIGIRPYDARAFQLLQKNFDTPEYRDPYWCDAYEACTLVGLAVTDPDSTDFSTSVGTGPFDENALDVLLVEIDDGFLAKAITEKGEAFMAAGGWRAQKNPAKALRQWEELKAAAEAKITSQVAFDNIARRSVLELYEADFWEDVGFSCINCGTCTYLCPTCWCFDIQDETHGKSGKRCKNWDSCMFPLFSLHASGHNPRGDKVMRVRQRFMHKLKYFLDKYQDGIMCVGCGRCVRYCPVNIDIRRICELMNRHDPQLCTVAS